MAKISRPQIVVDGISREMTEEEFSLYKISLEESKQAIDAKIEEIRNKEIAIAKLVALGLSESDLRSVGL